MSANHRHHAWCQRGITALASKGLASLPQLSETQFVRLQAALLQGPASGL
ncbi:hypothetical protein AB0395_23245 [Streptosporangium sp. NPDC051023]